MSESGTNRTWRDVRLESAFGGRAELRFRSRQVALSRLPNSDIRPFGLCRKSAYARVENVRGKIGNEAARVHYAGWRGGSLAACRACAAAIDEEAHRHRHPQWRCAGHR